jgi:hypothetical protein
MLGTMGRKPKIVAQGTVGIDYEGQRYTGSYTVEGGKVRTIEVHAHALPGTKVTQVGGMDVESLAGLLLLELVGQARAKASSGKK